MPSTLKRSRTLAWCAMPLALALITALGRWAGANAPTIVSFYLIVVLGLAAWGGWVLGATASVAAMLCFNYFFLPPFGTLTIAEPANWVALISFLAASTFASRLVATARWQAEEAQRRRREVETLAIERERLLEEAARLAAVRTSDALKTSLLRAVSHDLRTPLTAMRLEIESLDRHLEDRPEALASLRGLSLEQERLARRIDNLLSLARLEAGVAKPHPEPVPPTSLFRAARESLTLILAGRPVEVLVESHCPEIWTDPSLTLEILVNLLENAARASPPGQPIELAAGRDPKAPERVRIEVRDRGSGRGSVESASGGLGLRIAWSFAEANGGTFALLDRPGGGTIAWLELPATVEPEDEPEEVTA
jgi:K+-sensing histidine kinase KdpD